MECQIHLVDIIQEFTNVIYYHKVMQLLVKSRIYIFEPIPQESWETCICQELTVLNIETL